MTAHSSNNYKSISQMRCLRVFKQVSCCANHGSGKCICVSQETDTFGIVMLDALACGVPVAAYPVQGPIDVLIENKTGRMREDLQR